MWFESIVVMSIAVVGIYEGAKLARQTLLFDDPVGPGRYLFFMSALLFISGLALLVRQMRQRVSSTGGLSVLMGQAGQALLLLTLYALAASLAGYLPASVVFFVLAQWIFGERSWPRSAVLGLVITGGFYFVFSYIARVPFP